MDAALQVLGLSSHATRADLETAYRTKRAAYDLEQARTLGPEFVAVAEQRRSDLDRAYRDLRVALAAPAQLAPPVERARDRQTIIAVLGLVLLALLVPLLSNVAVPERTVTAVGADAAALASDVAPDFTLPTLDGQSVSLSDYQGKVVLINFWATWCPPCVREIPRLVRVSETYKDQGLVVLGVNTTYQDDEAKVRQFVADQGISYPVLLDANGDMGQKYPTRLMPTTYIIDRNGKIVHTKVGEVDETTLNEQIAALVNQAQTP